MCSLHRIHTMGECRRRCRRGSARPGQWRPQPSDPAPRRAPTHDAGLGAAPEGRRRGGGTGSGRSASGGSPSAAAWGAGAGGAGERPGVPAREEERERARETALLAAPAPGRRPALPCSPGSRSRPCTGRRLDACREAFPPPEKWPRGRAAPSCGGAGDGVVVGKTLRPGDQAEARRIPPALADFAGQPVARERAADQMVRPGLIPCGGWAHRWGVCWGRGAPGNFHRQKTKGASGRCEGKGPAGDLRQRKAGTPLPSARRSASLGPPEGGGASVWVEARGGLGVGTTGPPEFEDFSEGEESGAEMNCLSRVHGKICG